MALFKDAANADPAGARNYAKPGKYWVLVDYVSKKTSNYKQKGKEFMLFETTVIHVLEDCEGKGPKPGEPASFMFPEWVVGNANRLQAWVRKVMDADRQITEGEFETMVSAVQPLKNMVLEIFGTPDVETREKKKIVTHQCLRRVWAEEVRGAWASLVPAAKDLLTAEGRFDKMLAIEATEKQSAASAAPQTVAAGK